MHQDMDFIERMIDKYGLTVDEIKKEMKRGFITKGMVSPFLEQVEVNGYDETLYQRRLNPVGREELIKVNPMNCYILNGYNFIVSCFHLIISKDNNDIGSKRYFNNSATEYFLFGESVSFIPLKNIKRFEIIFGNYEESFYEIKKHRKLGDQAFNGACFGMMIGGPAGAIIGASTFAQNSGDYIESHLSKKNTYKLLVEFKDGEILIIDDFWTTNGKENNKENKMNKINAQIESLIYKNQNLTIEQKQKMLKEAESDYTLNNILRVMSIIVIIIAIIFIYVLSTW